jgi:hypothetical protein
MRSKRDHSQRLASTEVGPSRHWSHQRLDSTGVGFQQGWVSIEDGLDAACTQQWLAQQMLASTEVCYNRGWSQQRLTLIEAGLNRDWPEQKLVSFQQRLI